MDKWRAEEAIAALLEEKLPPDGILYKGVLLELPLPDGWEFYWLEADFGPDPRAERVQVGGETLCRLALKRGDEAILVSKGYAFFLGGEGPDGVWRVH